MARYGNAGGNASALRVGFEVKKGIKSSPNSAAVTIYNMSPQNRSNLTPGMFVTILAGYGSQMQLLSVGVIDTAKSVRDGPSISTTIECLDGASAITQVMINQTWGDNTPLWQIFQDIATAMQIPSAANPAGVSAGAVLGLPPDVFQFGYVAFGKAATVLDTLCRPRGLEWSIQNGGLQILPKGAHSGDEAEVVSYQTGLVGVPSLNKGVCEFTCLLNPSIAPGKLVYLDSRDVTGFYKVRGGKWEGDTHDNKWTCSVEAVEMPGVSQALEAAPGFNYGDAVAIT